MNTARVVSVIGLGVLIASLPVLIAWKQGADPHYSGGPAGYAAAGGNCTACHDFNRGPGSVELLGAPRRYRADAFYDLTVRVTDPEQQPDPGPPQRLPAAGFEISAEGTVGHLGLFELTDLDNTKYAAQNDVHYVTHTFTGYQDSRAHWEANGRSYDYRLGWWAPTVDSGPITLFVSGQAVDGSGGLDGDRYYSTYATMQSARAGDGDGDTDIDLFDFGAVQRCFDQSTRGGTDGCAFVDMNGDELMSLADAESFAAAMTGPTAVFPAGYVLADPVRGGLLYDTWWKVNGAREPQPDVNHPLYPVDGPLAGSTTFRCTECHGWDYKGVDGVYGSDILHFTGIAGVDGTTLTPQQLFDLLEGDNSEEGGHDMNSFGMSDRDIWDVVKMTLEGTVDTDDYIAPYGVFLGDPFTEGPNLYFTACWSCHGEGVDIGAVATENPWEFFHKVRFGHPGAPMPSLELLDWSLQSVADIGAYTATLAP